MRLGQSDMSDYDQRRCAIRSEPVHEIWRTGTAAGRALIALCRELGIDYP